MRRALAAFLAVGGIPACAGSRDTSMDAPTAPFAGVWVVDTEALAAGSPSLHLTAGDPANTAPVLVLGATSARVYGDKGAVEGQATLTPLDATRWMLATRTPSGDEHRTILTPNGPDRATFARAPDGQPLPLRRLPGASPIP
ncbi:MAG: hypothetical protein RLZZ383_2945 [Pseudomonadota bacterium]